MMRLCYISAFLFVVLLSGCASRTVLTTAQRDRLHFDAHRPTPSIELPRFVFRVHVEDEGATNFPADFPAVATFSFTVVGSPRSFGLWRSFDGGRTKTVWVKWSNAEYIYRDVSVSLPCTGPNNQLIQVGTWASNQP